MRYSLKLSVCLSTSYCVVHINRGFNQTNWASKFNEMTAAGNMDFKYRKSENAQRLEEWENLACLVPESQSLIRLLSFDMHYSRQF